MYLAAQVCLESPFERNESEFRFYEIRRDTIRSSALSIITSYQFQCCGKVTQWAAQLQKNGEVDITFHVWRPSPTSQTSGCYSLVGANHFSLEIEERLFTATPLTEIAFQPGDVVGFWTLRDRLVVLENQPTPETVWYAVINENSNTITSACTTEHSGTTTGAAPLLSVSIGKSLCYYD